MKWESVLAWRMQRQHLTARAADPLAVVSDLCGLHAPAELLANPGGVSGAPLKHRSLDVLRRLRARVGDRVLLVSVGGVETAEDVLVRIRAGATLVQGYTGFVYGGPLWARRINRELAAAVRAAGAATIQDLVGHEVGVGTRVAHAAPAPDRARG